MERHLPLSGKQDDLTYFDVPSRLQNLVKPSFLPIYRLTIDHVNCVPNRKRVTCEKVHKIKWSGELSDKCAAVVYAYYNTEVKNCTH